MTCVITFLDSCDPGGKRSPTGPIGLGSSERIWLTSSNITCGERRGGAVLSTCMPRERWQRHRSMHTCGERRGGAVLSTRLHRYWPASLNLTFASQSQSQISSLTSASRSQSPSQISSFTSATLATSCSRFSASLSSDCRLAVMFSANRRPTDANLPRVATVVSI